VDQRAGAGIGAGSERLAIVRYRSGWIAAFHLAGIGAARLPRSRQHRALLGLGGCALALEAVFVGGFLLRFALWQHRQVVASPRVLAALSGRGPRGALVFALAVLVAFALYALAIWIGRAAQGPAATALVLGATILFALTLLPTNPVTADDVYHNVADARTFWVHGENPLRVPPAAVAGDPLARRVPAWRDTPSAYGPLWYVVSGAPLPLTGTALWPAVLAQKALTALCLLGITALVLAAAGRWQPQQGVAAGILVGWCPLLLWETAGAAHNDSLTVCCAVAAVCAALRRWTVAVFPLLLLAVATKPTLAVLAPVLLIWLLRQEAVSLRAVGVSLLLAGALAVVLYLPVGGWAAPLAGLRRESQRVSSSPGALVQTTLAVTLHVNGLHVLTLLKALVWPSYLGLYAAVLVRLARRPDDAMLAGSSVAVMGLTLVLVTWWFMPWYLLWLLPLAALGPATRWWAVSAAFAAGAMLQYVPHFWLLGTDPRLLEFATAATAFLPPLVLALVIRSRGTAGEGPTDPRATQDQPVHNPSSVRLWAWL
jgi:alpha-1,6-mannosyltransferase